MLDLDGDGVELTALEGSAAHFDYDQDGFRESTGWLGSDDAFLIRDDNGDGRVNGIHEIFGSPEEDGFTALAKFDTNGDGRVDSEDAGFASLQLWRDLDGDGVFDNGEMFALSDYAIASINVEARLSGRISEGNTVAFEGSFTRIDGSTGQAEAVLFSTNRTITVWDAPSGFEVSALADVLPA